MPHESRFTHKNKHISYYTKCLICNEGEVVSTIDATRFLTLHK